MIKVKKEKENKNMEKPSQIIKDLKLKIPTAPSPVGSYQAFKISNKLIFLSGQLPINDNKEMIKGKLGKDLTLEQGQHAAYLCALNMISQLKNACDGNIDLIKSCIKITGYVNSFDNFLDQPKVINSASELLSNIFKEGGKHTRAAVSCNSLPLGAAVEIDGIFEII